MVIYLSSFLQLLKSTIIKSKEEVISQVLIALQPENML